MTLFRYFGARAVGFVSFPQHILRSVFLRSLLSRTVLFRPLFRTVGLCGLCLCGLVALFIGLQALAVKGSSDQRIISALNQALDAGIFDSRNFPMSIYGHHGLDYDMFTDCIAMATNLGNTDRSLLYRVAATPYVSFITPNSVDSCKAFVDAVRRNAVYADQPYFRYWHGHQIYLRPLLAHTSLENIHRVNAVLLITALGAFIILAARHFGMLSAPLILLPLLFGTNVLTTPASTVHALTWIWAFFSLAVATHWLSRNPVRQPRLLALIFSLGCVAAFFDVLFSPPFAPTFMAFIAVAFGMRIRGLARSVLDGAAVAFVWFAGFSLSWMSKWAFAAAVLGWDVVRPSLFDAIAARSFGDATLHVPRTLFTATRTAFNAQNQTMIHVAVIIALSVLLIAVVFGAPWRALLPRVFALMTPLLIPIVWVEILRDHTLYHPQFAARSFVYFAIIPLMATLYVWPHGHVWMRVRQWIAAGAAASRRPPTEYRELCRS